MQFLAFISFWRSAVSYHPCLAVSDCDCTETGCNQKSAYEKFFRKNNRNQGKKFLQNLVTQKQSRDGNTKKTTPLWNNGVNKKREDQLPYIRVGWTFFLYFLPLFYSKVVFLCVFIFVLYLHFYTSISNSFAETSPLVNYYPLLCVRMYHSLGILTVLDATISTDLFFCMPCLVLIMQYLNICFGPCCYPTTHLSVTTQVKSFSTGIHLMQGWNWKNFLKPQGTKHKATIFTQIEATLKQRLTLFTCREYFKSTEQQRPVFTNRSHSFQDYRCG